VKVLPATPEDWADVERLIRDYSTSFPSSRLPDVAAELDLPVYGHGVHRVFATNAGVVGVRRFDQRCRAADVFELLRPGRCRRALAEVGSPARSLGYRRLLLDTVARLGTAIALRSARASRSSPTANPLEDARYFALTHRIPNGPVSWWCRRSARSRRRRAMQLCRRGSAGALHAARPRP
jgi:hypothetical protein